MFVYVSFNALRAVFIHKNWRTRHLSLTRYEHACSCIWIVDIFGIVIVWLPQRSFQRWLILYYGHYMMQKKYSAWYQLRMIHGCVSFLVEGLLCWAVNETYSSYAFCRISNRIPGILMWFPLLTYVHSIAILFANIALANNCYSMRKSYPIYIKSS